MKDFDRNIATGFDEDDIIGAARGAFEDLPDHVVERDILEELIFDEDQSAAAPVEADGGQDVLAAYEGSGPSEQSGRVVAQSSTVSSLFPASNAGFVYTAANFQFQNLNTSDLQQSSGSQFAVGSAFAGNGESGFGATGSAFGGSSSDVESGTGNPIKVITTTGDAFIDGVLTTRAWASSTIEYSFPTSSSTYNYTTALTDLPANMFGMTAQQQQAVHFILNTSFGGTAQAGFSVEGITNLGVSWGSSTASTEIRLANTTSGTLGTARVGDFPAGDITSQIDDNGDVWFGVAYNFTNPIAGTYAWATTIHEIGHALGLSHGHTTYAGGVALPTAFDSMEYSVMTYRSYVGASLGGYTNETYGFAQTWMMADIAALQYMYGADYTTNSGDTVYKWNPGSGDTLVNGAVAIDAGGNRIFATIWDGGGIDTYDLSSYTTGVYVDLRAGNYSLFSSTQQANLGGSNYARGNIFNARLFEGSTASLIENAIGGSGNDTLIGNEANNVLTGNGGNDYLYGLDGNDTLYGNSGNDTLYGGNDNDFLNGGSGNDYLSGATGNDTLVGNNAGDSLYGGADNDYFRLTTSAAMVISGGTGSDTADFLTLGTSATDTTPRTIDVDLGYSFNGGAFTGTWSGIENIWSFANLEVTLIGNSSNNYLYASSQDDTLIGEGGDDSLYGIAGDDSLDGGSGNDYLSGGSGNDTLIGGSGIDTMYGGSGNDVITAGGNSGDYVDGGDGDDMISGGLNGQTLLGGAGNDTIYGDDSTPSSGVGDTIDGGAGNDSIVGANGGDSIDGGSGNDSIDGGSGNDTLEGGSGIDSVYGGSGNDTFLQVNGWIGGDTYDGGSGTDTLDYSGTIGYNSVANLSTGSLTGAGAAITLVSIENILAGNGADNITGSSSANLLDGGAGNDSINGGSGNDTLLGGAGNDLIKINSGWTGGDTNDGGAGIDTFMLNFSSSGGYDINLATGTFNGGGDTTSTLVNIENLITSNGNDTLTGNSSANVLTALGGDDILNGGSGNDTLLGGAGNDTLEGGSGVDSINGGAGDDLILINGGWTGGDINDGGSGVDTFMLNFLTTSSYNINLATGTFNGGGDTTSTLVNIENLITSNGNDVITGSSSANLITTLGGDDSINGGAGNDTVVGGSGADTILGANGADVLYGNVGQDRLLGGNDNDSLYGGDDNDILNGGNGDDLLNGGNGNDLLLGGVGADTIYGNGGNDIMSYVAGQGYDDFNGGSGTDTIVVSNAWTTNMTYNLVTDDYGTTGVGGYDLILVENIRAGGGDDVLIGSGQVNVLKGGLGDDTISGANGDDVLFGDAGDDQVFGGNDNDRLYGGGGNDMLTGGDGADTIYGNGGDDTMIYESGAGYDDFNGGSGIDTIVVSNAWTNNMTYNLVTDDYGSTGSGGYDAISVENVTAGGGDDVLSGDAGDDRLLGGNNNDTLTGGDGNDIVNAGSGADVLFGNADDDRLFGGSGNDTLDGGAGDDRLFSGSGADDIIFNVGNEVDRVMDFTNDVDELYLDRDLWGGGGLNKQQVVDTYASVIGSNIVFDFGGGDMLILNGYTNIGDLADDLIFT